MRSLNEKEDFCMNVIDEERCCSEIGNKNPCGQCVSGCGGPKAEDPKKEFQEAEKMISRSDSGLELDFLYIGDDGHLEFAYFDCDMTPPAPFEPVFDLTFSREETEKLRRALGIEDTVIAGGGEERFVRVFRALMRYLVPRYDSIALSGEFSALLRANGIRVADGEQAERLHAGSPFQYERSLS